MRFKYSSLPILILLGCSWSCDFKVSNQESEVSDISEKIEGGLHTIQLSTVEEARDFYTWSADRIPMVSAHRGGPYPGFPENSLEAFANVLRYTPAIIELDVAMTKDSVLVLMHDDDLDRTTNGHGPVIEATYSEIQDLFLEDMEGNLTEFKVPTLKEALVWSKGKALLTVDVKRSVPFEKIIEEIRETGSEAHAAVISYTFPAAKKLHRLAPELMLSVTIRNEEEIKLFEETRIPWTRVIAFTGISERPLELNQLLHQKGVFTILGVLGNLDKSAEAKGDKIYIGFVQRGADILATDRPIEAAAVLETLIPSKSSKSTFFIHDN
jgi:glycerophosphoryl diester phosphodiesterase